MNINIWWYIILIKTDSHKEIFALKVEYKTVLEIGNVTTLIRINRYAHSATQVCKLLYASII